MTRELGRAPFLQLLAERAHALFGGLAAIGYSLSPSGDDLNAVGFAGVDTATVLRAPLQLLDAAMLHHAVGDTPALLTEAEILLPTGEAPRFPPLGAALLIPLRTSQTATGLLVVIGAPGDAVGPRAVSRAESFAQQLGPALENLRAVEALRDLVIRDDTADCYNRRYLDQSLDDETERARRFGERFALIFLDMDNLKEVNTRFGHAAGSRVLYEASVRIGRSIRSIDRLFRYGGDEFVILLPNTGLEGAREVAERVRRSIAARPFEMPGHELAPLTASTGVSSWPEHGPEARGLVEAGDAAMRRVKAEGKNAVGVAPVGRRGPTMPE